MDDDEEILLELLTEGGSLKIVRIVHSECHEVFIAKLNEMNYELDEIEASNRVLGGAESFTQALSLLDPYPWQQFHPYRVAKEIELVVLAAVTERGGAELGLRWRRMVDSEN